MNPRADYTFEIAVHPRPDNATGGPRHVDARGTWDTLVMPAGTAPRLGVDFDHFLVRLAALPRMFIEPDGALLWVGEPGPDGTATWQVDGNAWERDGRLLRVDLKGSCSATAFGSLLQACGWPTEPLAVELIRPAVLLDIETFHRHARARGS